ARVSRRPAKSFGIFPVVKSGMGRTDALFQYLPRPFYVADFREYQVVEPNYERLQEIGGNILAIEHPDVHDFEHQAIMAVRFSDEIYGTQFHPEAFPEGMLRYFAEPDRREHILEGYGSTTYEEMMFHLRDPIKVQLTHNRVLPGFLNIASNSLSSQLTNVN
ncbi:MAG: GMP synthase, partial [Saprospiraceae bacterium]|nr:GMP synthase [Saprospiraceae bacterium]